MANPYTTLKIICGDRYSHTSSITRTRTGKTEQAAYEAAMPIAINLVREDIRHWNDASGCPSNCPERKEYPSTFARATYSWSLGDWLASLVPFSGIAGGWSCTATFSVRLTIICEKAGG